MGLTSSKPYRRSTRKNNQMSRALLRPDRTAVSYRVLGAASVCHMLNDTMQSLFVAAYPIFKGNFHLSFSQIGALTLVFQVTASLLQPLVGLYTDRKPQPYSLPFGMAISMSGLFHWRTRQIMRCCCLAVPCWASVRRSSIRKLPGSPGWLLAGRMGWRSRFFRLAETSARP